MKINVSKTFLIRLILVAHPQALRYVIFLLESRRFSQLKVLLMTDGQSNIKKHLTVPNAQELKAIGVEIFVVAVGDKNMPGIPEMARVASRPPETHVFRVEKNSDAKYVFELALEKVSNNKYKAKKPLADPCSPPLG